MKQWKYKNYIEYGGNPSANFYFDESINNIIDGEAAITCFLIRNHSENAILAGSFPIEMSLVLQVEVLAIRQALHWI